MKANRKYFLKYLLFCMKKTFVDVFKNSKMFVRCGVENLEHKLRKMRLRWFCHVKRRDENSILRRAMELHGGEA